MPGMRAVSESANALFNSGNVGKMKEHVGKFQDTTPLGTIAGELNIANSAAAAYLNGMPRCMQGVVKALVASNLLRSQPWGIQFVWFAASEWELTISEEAGTPGSKGAIFVSLRSPRA